MVIAAVIGTIRETVAAEMTGVVAATVATVAETFGALAPGTMNAGGHRLLLLLLLLLELRYQHRRLPRFQHHVPKFTSEAKWNARSCATVQPSKALPTLSAKRWLKGGCTLAAPPCDLLTGCPTFWGT